MCARLQDAESSVRNVAVEAIAKIAEKGDASAIPALCARLQDADSSVQNAAVEAIATIARKGDASVIAALAREI
ncbi:MAG: hypothetical protein CMH99_09690 [Oceanospirillaceae bacterium]|nr:hypothetical protein [Oceanospirillaceae bacterium]